MARNLTVMTHESTGPWSGIAALQGAGSNGIASRASTPFQGLVRTFPDARSGLQGPDPLPIIHGPPPGCLYR